MKSTLRATSIEDLNRVRQFLQRAFNTSPDNQPMDDALMAWKYWDRRDDWEEPRAYVLERDGVILAHAGIYPLTFGAGEVRGIQMIDWASAKESPGAGLALLQKLSAMFDFIYSIGGSEMTCKILPAYGFVQYSRQWKGARPLRPFQQIVRHQYRNWKLGPRLVRNILWSLPKSGDNVPCRGWTFGEIGPDEVSKEFSSQSMTDGQFSPRGPGFFEYLLRCPIMRVRLYRVQDQGGPVGHFAIGVLRGQARLAGVWLRDPNPERWQTAFYLAQQVAAQTEGAFEIAIAGSEGASEQGAVRSGLRIRGYKPVFLLNKKGKLSLPPDFQFQLADDDAFFLDMGTPSYWT